jgi:hypothetical protein
MDLHVPDAGGGEAFTFPPCWIRIFDQFELSTGWSDFKGWTYELFYRVAVDAR